MRHEHIERLLPANYQRVCTPGSPLSALLSVMQQLHAPSEATLLAVDDLVAPYRAPDRLVPFLVRWVAWEHLLGDGTTATGVPVGRLRDLVAGAAGLAARRGTAGGLTELLTLLCGVRGFVIDEPAGSPFHIVVRVPAAAGAHLDLIRRVVAAEKPASTTSEIRLEPAAGPDPDSPKE